MKNEIILGGFRKRRMPLIPDYRPMYKIGLLVCVLKIVSGGGKSSLNKLHFFIWALKSKRNMDFITMLLETNDSSNLITWGVEPALNKALSLGVAEDLFVLKDDKYTLTSKGDDFYKEIKKDKELFADEKRFLEGIGKRMVTEDFIKTLTTKFSN